MHLNFSKVPRETSGGTLRGNLKRALWGIPRETPRKKNAIETPRGTRGGPTREIPRNSLRNSYKEIS